MTFAEDLRPEAELQIELRDGVGIFTLNKPDRLNALSVPLIDHLVASVTAADASPDVHAVLLRGAGRGFCGGYDMKAALEGTDEGYGSSGGIDLGKDMLTEFRTIRGTNHRLRPLWESTIPIISAVHGHCVAGGMELLLHTDLIICAQSARIGFPPARSQGSPPSSLLLQRLGMQWTKRMLFTGDVLSGETAARIGLALEVVENDQLDARSFELASRVALVDKGLLAANKLAIHLADSVANQSLANDLSALVDAATGSLPAVKQFRDDAMTKGPTVAWKERNERFLPDAPI